MRLNMTVEQKKYITKIITKNKNKNKIIIYHKHFQSGDKKNNPYYLN